VTVANGDRRERLLRGSTGPYYAPSEYEVSGCLAVGAGGGGGQEGDYKDSIAH